jgi:hypothetical protein
MRFSHPDRALVKDQLKALQIYLHAWGIEKFCQLMFWILAKEAQEFEALDAPAILVPFRFNREQRIITADMGQRNLLLKSRQIGGTTFFLLVRLLLNVITKPGTGSVLISQNGEYAEKHFRIAHRAYQYIGAVDPYDQTKNDLNTSLRRNLLHTSYSNRRELIFDQLHSVLMVMSAEVEESGQGVTLHHILADEYSRWPGKPEDTLSNVAGALVKTGTLDKNCTANGAAGPFYEDCLRAMNDPANSDAKFFFFPWWFADDYTLQLTEAEKDELEKDLEEEELQVIQQMHRDLSQVAWTGPTVFQGATL